MLHAGINTWELMWLDVNEFRLGVLLESGEERIEQESTCKAMFNMCYYEHYIMLKKLIFIFFINLIFNIIHA